AKPYPLGIPAHYAGVLNATIRKLNTDRAKGLARLKAATTQKAQAVAARAVSRAYARAARRIAGVATTSFIRQAHARIVSDLRQVSSSYGQLANAAGSGNRGGYGRARARIRGQEAG